MSWIVLALLIGLLAVPLVIEGNRTRMNADARDEAPGLFADLPQGITHYQWFGPTRGPVLVCVHGLTTPSFVWGRLVRGLALLGFRILTYDLYGRGFSDRPRGPQTRQFFLQQLEDLLAYEGLDRREISILGYSMGGAIATVYAADNPTRIVRLMLIAPAGMGVVAAGVVRWIAKTRVVGDWLMLAVYPSRFRRGVEAEGDAEIGALQLRELEYRGFIPAVVSSLRGILSDDLRDDHRIIANYGIPVLAIWGREDTIIPLTAMGQLAEWNRAARQDVIDGAEHGLTYTHPEEVLAEIRDFVAETR